MPHAAKVTSIQAVEEFKADLIVYLEKARRILDAVGEEVVRTRIELQTDRQLHWKNLVRQRARALAQAEQELLTARLSGMPEAIKARRMVVANAKRNLHEAEAGLVRVRQWLRQYETEVESRAKVLMQLRHRVSDDMSKAVAFLEGAASTLAAYAQMTHTVLSNPPVAADRTDAPAAEVLADERLASGGGAA